MSPGSSGAILQPSAVGPEKAIQQKLDRLDEAYLFARTIDLTGYERQRDRLREELTLAQTGVRRKSI